jgi:hypothetical protein
MPVAGSVAAVGSVAGAVSTTFAAPSFLENVQRAVGVGWRQLGSLTNDSLREYDILYNADDSKYYVFSTEQNGNPGPEYVYVITQTTPGASTLITFADPHELDIGGTYYLTISGCDVAALNGSHAGCTIPSQYTILVPVTTSVGATAGSIAKENRWNILSSVPSSSPTIVTLDRPHGLAGNGRVYALTITGVTDTGATALNSTGPVGNEIPRFVTAPTPTTISVSVTTTGAATTGQIAWVATSPMIGMRRATTPEGITAATGSDYISRVGTGHYFPTILKLGSGAASVWHMWGTVGAASMSRRRFSGTAPTGQNVFGSAVTQPHNVGDPQVKYNPADGKYYMVGVMKDTDPADNEHILYWTSDVTVDANWAIIGSGVWQSDEPEWAAGNKPDPSLLFYGGKAYLLFNARPTDGGGLVVSSTTAGWNAGIVELNLTTGRAVGDVVRLQTYGSYASWQGGRVLADLVGLVCHDGVLRIFGACNGSMDVQGSIAWGCLDILETGEGGAIVGSIAEA